MRQRAVLVGIMLIGFGKCRRGGVTRGGSFQVVFASSLILRLHASRTFAVAVARAIALGFES